MIVIYDTTILEHATAMIKKRLSLVLLLSPSSYKVTDPMPITIPIIKEYVHKSQPSSVEHRNGIHNAQSTTSMRQNETRTDAIIEPKLFTGIQCQKSGRTVQYGKNFFR